MTADPATGSAVMDLHGLRSRDYIEIVNALLEGPFLPATVSFRVEWSPSTDRHHFRYPPETWEADVVLNTAKAWWRGETADAIYVADAIETSASLFAEVGQERSGIFFS